MLHKQRAERNISSKGGGLFRLLALGFLAALLVLPLGRSASAADEGWNSPEQNKVREAMALRKLGEYRQRYQEYFNYFSKLPRARGFVVAAQDCNHTKRWRRELQRYILSLQELKAKAKSMKATQEEIQRIRDADTIARGKLSTEWTNGSSDVHAALAKYDILFADIDELTANIQSTDVQDKCIKKKEDAKGSGWTSEHQGTKFTPLGEDSGWTSVHVGSTYTPSQDIRQTIGSPGGSAGGGGLPGSGVSEGSGLGEQGTRRGPSCPTGMRWDGSRCVAVPEQTISCSGGAVPARDEYGQLACFCPSRYPVWDGSRCVTQYRPQPQPTPQPSQSEFDWNAFGKELGGYLKEGADAANTPIGGR